MISGRRKCKEIERKSFGAKTGQKQGKNRGLRDFAASVKLALRYEIVSQHKRSHWGINVPLRKQSSFAKPISQLNWLFYENFRSCETKYGTRVPLRNTATPISQLQNDCEATKRENSQFRNQSSISQGISKLRNQFWHTSAISQHSDPHFAVAKRVAKWAAKIVFSAKTPFCYEIDLLLRNSKWPLIFRYFFINTDHLSCERVSERGKAIATVCSFSCPSPTTREPPVISSGHHFRPNFVSPIWREPESQIFLSFQLQTSPARGTCSRPHLWTSAAKSCFTSGEARTTEYSGEALSH